MVCRVCIAILLMASPAAAADDPLRFLPKSAGVVVKIERPRMLVEGIVKLDAYRGLAKFPQVREVLESTNVRRFFQLVKHLENETGSQWPELLDKLAGRGIAIGFKTYVDPPPALAVIEGTDEAVVAKVYDLFIASVVEDAARDGKQAVKKAILKTVPTLQIGDEFCTARLGAVVFLANNIEALHAGLKLALNETTASVLEHASLPPARKLIGTDAAAWLWFDLAAAKQRPEAKDFFDSIKKEIVTTFAIGSTVDALRRAEFVAAGLYQSGQGLKLSIRIPAKRAELDMALHAPKIGEPGSRPLLMPPGVVASQSFYLDLGHFWTHRSEIVNPEALKDLEKGVADASKVLPGTTIGKLLEQSGPYHRLVMVQTGEKLYTREPGQVIPPFAIVTTMRDPAFGKTMDGILRAGGLIASFQTGWKASEQIIDEIPTVSYRFPETGDAKFPDPDHLRFNFVPTFGIVGDALVVGSTPGVVKAVIGELKKESKAPGAPEVWRARAVLSGAADVVAAHPEMTITDTVLTQGIGLKEAKKQVADFTNWLRTLGVVDLSIDHGAEMYKFDFDWKMKN